MAKSQKIIITLILALIYIPTFFWMWDRWFARDSYYSHGILIPFVSAYLIWLKKDDLAKIPKESSAWGFRLILIAIIIHLLSALFKVYFTSGFSLIILIFGLILHFYGSKILKEILFPIGFLFFMIPLPMVIISNVSFKLKLFAADIATYIINNNLRIDCKQVGSTLYMPHSSVVVDDVCSGLRSLISLTALGSLFAYWLKAGPIKKTILFLSTIPIAVLTNVIRVIFLALVGEFWGSQYVSGFIHDFSGFAVFALAFIMLYLMERILE